MSSSSDSLSDDSDSQASEPDSPNKSPEDKLMLIQAKDQDEEEEQRIKAITDELAKKSGFRKLLPYNNPKYLMILGVFFSVLDGIMMILTGWMMSHVIFVMAFDEAKLEVLAKEDSSFTATSLSNIGSEYLEHNVKFYTFYMFLFSVAQGLSSMI